VTTPVRGLDLRMIDGLGSTRRLRGLWRLGWINDDLAERYDVPRVALDAVLDRLDFVSSDVAAKIDLMWRELKGIPGPHWRAIAQAERAGWAASYSWTADTVDDPEAKIYGCPDADKRSTVSARVLRSRILEVKKPRIRPRRSASDDGTGAPTA
jgi:hypothetical protein